MRKTLRISTFLVWAGAGIPVLVFCAVISGLLGAFLGLYLAFSSMLPTLPDLRAYRPKTVSTFYADDGTVIGIFYKEKRFPLPLADMPPHVISAFLAAEDARFFSHTGLDWIGVFRAFTKNLKAGNFAQGGSTITQQVTRNFLLSKEKKISRKVREAILAYRLEKTLTKNEILELYLNEIYLGKGAYGVEAAAATYFGKTTGELSVAEAALLAGLVSNPSKYSQSRNLEMALKRRELVLARMLRNGFISQEQYQLSKQDVPQFRENLPSPFERVPYFTEAVRQYIVAKYGEDSLYNQGLRVWTTCNLELQKTASEALIRGVKSWEKRQGRPIGLVRRLESSEVISFIKSSSTSLHNVGEMVLAVVVANNTAKKRKGKKVDSEFQECTLALRGDVRFKMELPGGIPYRMNDLLQFRVMENDQGRLSLEHLNIPPVQGAVVCIENSTGYVSSLVGGLDFEQSNFNRATQALRQPGSAFKPFVYAAALEWFSYSPSTVVVDEPIAVVIEPRNPPWVPTNSDGGFLGPITLTQALARSRNIAAIKLFMDVGMDSTIQMARNMGIKSPLGKNLSLCLGASEVTLLELTSAYTVFPNMGVRVHPVLIKKVVDRFGNVLEDNTREHLNTAESTSLESSTSGTFDGLSTERSHPLAGDNSSGASRSGLIEEMRSLALKDFGTSPNVESFLATSFPSRPDSRPPMQRVLTPQSAYLMLSMLREACVVGTAASVSRLHRKDLAGKTGTTDDCADAWFVGFNPKYSAGVWIGYDAKVSLGRSEYGNVAALPVWMDFMKKTLQAEPFREYPIPSGIVFRQESIPSASHRTRSLLEAEPDLGSGLVTKSVSPVDTTYFPLLAYRDPITGQSMDTGFAPMNYSGNMGYWPGYSQTLRVLSPSGESLGHAYYARDDKGKTTMLLDGQMPETGLYDRFGPPDPYGMSFRSPEHDPGGYPRSIHLYQQDGRIR